MKKHSPIFLSICSSFILLSQQPSEGQLRARAQQLADQFIIVDTHIDVPYRLRNKMEDISQKTETGEFDYPRAKQGGLDAPFMSIYVPAEHETKKIAKQTAEDLLNMMDSIAARNSNKFSLAKSTTDVIANAKKGILSFCYGMENGSPVEGNLENLKYFYDRGIRYITLTHGKDNHIGDSSYDTTHTWKGLSPFGKQVVAEMNRLGIMVDISHVSDQTFFQVMELTKAPAIASHSSCRSFTPGFERNMSDEMIQRLAKNGGVIQINFGSSFLNGNFRLRSAAQRKEIQAYLEEHKLTFQDSLGRAYTQQYQKDHPLGYQDVKDVADHIDHVRQIAGAASVGFGSDFDGVGDELPTSLKDVSMYPSLIYELLIRGYSESEIEGICGKNLLRVWKQVEQVAKNMRARK